jgi:hypothetical protein
VVAHFLYDFNSPASSYAVFYKGKSLREKLGLVQFHVHVLVQEEEEILALSDYPKSKVYLL